MLTVTKSASAYMAQMLAEDGATGDTVLRIISKDNYLSMVMDEPKPDDVTFSCQGKVILVFDKDLSSILEELKFDLKDTDEGAELSLS